MESRDFGARLSNQMSPIHATEFEDPLCCASYELRKKKRPTKAYFFSCFFFPDPLTLLGTYPYALLRRTERKAGSGLVGQIAAVPPALVPIQVQAASAV